MDRGAWWDMVHGIAESDPTEAAEHMYYYYAPKIGTSMKQTSDLEMPPASSYFRVCGSADLIQQSS